MAKSPDLYDWDTAFAMRVSDFNRLTGASTDTRERTHPPRAATATTAPATLTWRFGAWSVSSAVGSQIELNMPLQPGSKLEMDAEHHDLSGCTCIVTTEMVFKPMNGGTGSQTCHALGTNYRQGKPWAEVEVRSGQEALPFRVADRVQQILDDWFRTDAALQAFDAHFDGLRINTSLAADGKPWLAPRAVGFAGATLPDGSTAIGLLARVERADIVGARFMLSPYAIPDPSAAGFVISAERFFDKLLVPALARAFGTEKGDKSKAFKVAGGRIQNLEALKFRLTTANNDSYDATIPPQQLEVSIDGDELVLDLRDMSFDVPLGPVKWETIHISMVERLNATLVSPKGQPDHRVLVFSQSGEPQITRRDEDSWYKIGGQVLLDIGTAIASVLVLKYLGAGIAKRGVSVIARFVLLALCAVVASKIGEFISGIPDRLTELTDDDLRKLPDFGRLVDDGLKEIHWRTDAGFGVESVHFADSLQFTIRIR